MSLPWESIRKNAIGFSKRWKDAKDERAEAQSFLNELLSVFGVDTKRVATFESKVHQETDRNGYIDLLWPSRILIEMKSRGRSLDKAYTQARQYAFAIENDEELPEYIMVCDFERIRLYRQTTNQYWEFKVAKLSEHIKKLSILTDHATKYDFIVDKELNVKAAYKMASLHDALKENRYDGHVLEVYLVRLLFCLFADDAGIFHKGLFLRFLSECKEDGSDLSGKIMELFDVLNTAPERRQSSLPDLIKDFPYVNGGLFVETLRPASFDAKMRRLLLECCEFDWSAISPSIFGSMFQGVMNPDERRTLGAHYTSEQNILKLIKPLFLDDLYEEFEKVKSSATQLEHFHKKLSQLTFLDPACGCGNFLIITYRELRLLELEILKMQINDDIQTRFSEVLKDKILINVNQFYGIELEEFPCRIAQTGLWLMDHIMNNLVAEHFGIPFVRLPLTESATIVNESALNLNWEDIVPKSKLSFIIGNPPFIGYSLQSEKQKAEILSVYVDENKKSIKNAGKIDYVAAWYYKAAEYMSGTSIRTAFVSTNSIAQGEQVAAIWKPLNDMFHVHIDFGYRTFIWSNEAKGKAAVHCVIVGFSTSLNSAPKIIYEKDGTKITAKNINAYLVDAPDVFIGSRTTALCDVPSMVYGNKPTDGGHLFIESSEYNNFIAREPEAKKYIKKIYGATEYINNIDRYCLWLANASPAELKKMPLVMDRIEKVRQFRLTSPKKATRVSATMPTLFQEIRHPSSEYIIIPRHSSEKRKYIPFGFVSPDIIVNDAVQIIPNATVYHFGILTSNVHMAWVRAVCGRIKSDYRYSKDIVYNNFPWPEPTEKQRQAIETAAQEVLDVREQFTDSSLADLYDPLTMPPELSKAHTTLNKAVWKAYGANWKSETECVADLMKRYQCLVEAK